MDSEKDRFGLGWRQELADGIVLNLDQIDVVEVIADDFLKAPKRRLSMLKTICHSVPTYLHGVGLGMASTVRVDAKRLDAMARLVAAVEPAGWSEHLSFVRGGGHEIGHLTAPPRTEATVAGAIRNIRDAVRVVGMQPCMENIATLFAPPASTMDEASWVNAIIFGADVPLLLDLHNLYANAVNFGQDPVVSLLSLPLSRVSLVHLSGGHWINEPGDTSPPRQRLLDDHVHDVPPAVFDLLEALASETHVPLTVIIERDGAYPAFSELLTQLQLARAAVTRGRAKRRYHREEPHEQPSA